MTEPRTDRMTRELMDLTNQPTAPAREDAVVAWIKRWIARRRGITLKRDRFGNMLLKREAGQNTKGQPLLITAHLDHPAFVVTDTDKAGERVTADFRGGVAERYFAGSPVRLWQGGEAVQTGRVVDVAPATKRRPDKRATIELDKPASPRVDDIVTWRLPSATRQGDRLRAPVSDDLAGVAAALHAFDQLRKDHGTQTRSPVDVRVLLTRCEEIGLVGAMAACESGLAPKNARLVLLENSKSFAESPIGGGPIIRVGDRTSTFDPTLTYQLGQLAERVGKRDDTFHYQRKLMPGGVCEATAFLTRGRAATCLCLPLGNYHNMNERTGRIDREIISLSDYHGLVRLLIEAGRAIDAPVAGPSLCDRLNGLFDKRRHLLEPR